MGVLQCLIFRRQKKNVHKGLGFGGLLAPLTTGWGQGDEEMERPPTTLPLYPDSRGPLEERGWGERW